MTAPEYARGMHRSPVSISTGLLFALIFAPAPLAGCVEVVETPLPESELASPPSIPSRPVELAAAWLSGSFSSGPQSREDPRFREITLEVVPIWTGRDDGPWLYVEQAAATSPALPYRQRIYQLLADGDGVLSLVYELPGDPLLFAGAWRTPARFDALLPDLLLARDGCGVRLRQAGPNRLTGGTEGTGCRSSLRGATYATSEVTLTPQWMETLDRGFDANGVQVWGSEHGPYRFERLAK